MVTCTFWGHREIYDFNLDRSIRSAVAKVMADGEAVEFLFHVNSEFYTHCLAMVLEAKHKHPQRVKLILLVTEENAADNQVFPACLFDAVLQLKAVNKDDIPEILWRQILASQYVVSYFYVRLCEIEEQRLTEIRECPNITEIDLTQKDTAAFIQNSAELAERKSDLILRQAGCSLVKDAGVAGSFISEEDSWGDQEQRLLILKWLCRQRIAHRPVPPTTCAMMLSGSIRDLDLFRNTTHFIISAFGISVFGVGQIHCFNQYAMELGRIISSYNHVQMTAYINVDTSSGNQENNLQSIYAPMYASVLNTDTKARTLRGRIAQVDLELLRHSEYVIYDSNKDSELNKITQRKIDRFRRKLKVIDLGNMPCVESREI